MKIIIERRGDTGRIDDWVASSEQLPRPGIGRVPDEALGSLILSNMPELGISELETREPKSAHPVVTWRASRPVAQRLQGNSQPVKIVTEPRSDLGRADERHASSEQLPRPGIGRTWGEALMSIVRANLPELGITEIEIRDPKSENPATVGTSPVATPGREVRPRPGNFGMGARMTKCDLTVIESLCIVVIRGFEAKPEDELAGTIDPPGSVNHFCTLYGMAENLEPPGIFWTDYEWGGGSWDFAVLISSDELEQTQALVVEAGYELVEVVPVTEPICFGDANSGTVEVLRHRDGWVVMN